MAQDYDEKYPFGKGATVVTQDNINMSQQARAAAKAVRNGTATPADHALHNDRQRMIKEAVEN